MDRKYIKKFKITLPKADIPMKNIYSGEEIAVAVYLKEIKNKMNL